MARLRARSAARLASVPGGFTAVPSDWPGYAPLTFVPAERSNVRLAAVPSGLTAVPSDWAGYAPLTFVPDARSSARVASVPAGLPRVPSDVVEQAASPSPDTSVRPSRVLRFMDLLLSDIWDWKHGGSSVRLHGTNAMHMLGFVVRSTVLTAMCAVFSHRASCQRDI